MNIIYGIAVVLLMAALARMAGGGLGAHILNKKGAVDSLGRDKGGALPYNLTFLPEVAFGAVFGVMFDFKHSFHGWEHFYAIAAAGWSYYWLEAGHGIAMHMGRRPRLAQGKRKQRLSFIIDPLCRAIGAPLGGLVYCWAFMGLKGLLIGLPAAPFGLLLAFLWPAAYHVERHYIRDFKWSEYLSGGSAGLVIAIESFLPLTRFFP
jgi:hypothetical protein